MLVPQTDNRRNPLEHAAPSTMDDEITPVPAEPSVQPPAPLERRQTEAQTDDLEDVKKVCLASLNTRSS